MIWIPPPIAPAGRAAGLPRAVADILGRRIVGGIWQPGHMLPKETELGAALSVSRPAVRAAITLLVTKGLVEPRRRRGTLVLPMSRWNLFDPVLLSWFPTDALKREVAGPLLEFRQAVEPSVAAWAAQRMSAEEVAALRDAYQHMATAREDAAFSAADVQFHRLLFLGSGNPLFTRLEAVIEPLLRSFLDRSADTVPMSTEPALTLHRMVLAGITGRKPDEARRAMEALLTWTAGQMVDQ